ncbi:MAG: hypothetical protein GY929_18020 [Actinomycetia bacterium]|nr:hypothetical protein [Actinomycetes bacterium]
MRTLLLVLHIVGVAAWLGGNLTQMMVLPMMERAEHTAAMAWHRASGQMAKIYYSIAGTVIMVTGIGLVLDGPYAFSDGFVSVGFLVVVIGGVMGVVFFAPTSRAAITAHELGGGPNLQAVLKRFTVGAIVDTGLVIFTVYAMVAKL